MTAKLDYRSGVLASYPEVFTPAALQALEVLAPLNRDRRELMAKRVARRTERQRGRHRIAFLDPQALIPRTNIRVQDARDGKFEGSEIPRDLKRQWIQGTGPVTKPRASTASSLRNAAYALLSGADGWMFDGEDALGQVDTMSLENQRNLQLAISGDPRFLRVAEEVAGEMNKWAQRIFRPRDCHRLAQATQLHHQNFPRPRPASRRPARARSRWHRLFRINRGPGALRGE